MIAAGGARFTGPGNAAAGFDVPVRARVYLAAAAVAVLVGIPAFGSTILILRATEIAVFAVAFVGLHILSGRLGLISVGHGAMVGLGALGAAHAIDDASLPFLLAPLAGFVTGAAIGALIAVPSLRLPGAYLALLTLAIAMVLPIAMNQIDGPLGYRVQGDIVVPGWVPLGPADADVWQYVLVLTVGAGIVAVTALALQGRFTRALIACRDDPVAAAAFGIDVGRTRLLGVMLSAAIAGAAGGLGLYASPLVSSGQFPFRLSVSMFALMLALGASRLWTVVPAAVVLVLLPDLLVRLGYAAWEPIIYAVVLLVMTRVSRGEGLVTLLDRYRTVITVPDGVEYETERLPATPATQATQATPSNPFMLTREPPARR